MTVLFSALQREQTAQRVAGLMRADDRIEALILVGSLATEPDRWSDIDLCAAVVDGAELPVVATDWVERLYEELPVVHHFETAFGETLVRGFLLENLLEVDLAFERVARFSVWGPATVVFDRSGRIAAAAREPVAWRPAPPDWSAHAGIAWHDVFHAGVAVRRGRFWQGLWYLERIRNRTLALAAERRGLVPTSSPPWTISRR